MQVIFLKVIFISICFFLNTAIADLSFSRNARTFETQHSSLVVKGLAHSCLSIAVIPDGMLCNPALTSLLSKPTLSAQVLLSNGSSALENVRKLLNTSATQELVDTLFKDGKIIQIEGNADVNFKSNFLNAQYSPFTVKGFSVVRNEANPDVELYAVEEKSFTLQSGREVFSNLFLGAQIRSVQRKFIRQQFKLVTLATEAGKDILKPKTQSAVYFEPALTWYAGIPWKPRFSLFVANLGNVSEQFDELKTPVEVQYGAAISPPLLWGELDINLEVKSMNYEETFIEKLRLGALYKFGSMFLTSGIDANGGSAGIFYSLDKINAGILYSTTKLLNQEEEFFTQTVYVQLGWQI